MVFRRAGDQDREEVVEEQDDGLNIISDEDGGGEPDEDLFAPGDLCWSCQEREARVGFDPSCHGTYDGEAQALCYECLADALEKAYAAIDGIAAVVEPFGEHKFHLYYRLDEMPAYQFPRDDIEPLSWLLLTIGDGCAECGEQSHFAWLTRDFVDPELPEDPGRPVFRNLDGEIPHLCGKHTAVRLLEAYRSRRLPVMTVEVPRSAMGVLMPSGE